VSNYPEVSGLECANALRKMGFTIATIDTRAITLRRDGRIVIISRSAALSEGELRLILSRTGLPLADLLTLVGPRGESREVDLRDFGEETLPVTRVKS
jgi:hypothetical protein